MGDRTLAVVAPTRVVELAFAASPLPVVVGLVRLLGSSFTVAALATYCLQDAAFNSRLGSATYQRLGLGLMWWAIASLVVLWASPAKPLLRPHLALSGVLALVAVGTGVLYNDTSKHGLHPLHLAKGFLSSFAQLLAPPSNPWAAAYGAASVAAGAAATALWAGTSGAAWVPAPLAHAALLVAPLGTIGRLVAQLLGAGTLLAAVVLFVLKDAAERGRLGASTFKTLNVGVFSAALALGGFATHSPPLLAGARFAAALAGGSAVLAGATAFQYFFAKKNLRQPPAVRYSALALFQRAAGWPGSGTAAYMGGAVDVQGHQLLVALGCVLLAAQSHAAGSKTDAAGAGRVRRDLAEQLARAYRLSLRPDYSGPAFTAADIEVAAAETGGRLGREGQATAEAPLVARILELAAAGAWGSCETGAAARAAGGAAGGALLGTCWRVVELLHSAEARGAWRQVIDRGGALAAAAVLAAALCIAAPPQALAGAPSPLSRLAQLSGFPEAVVRSNAAAILHFVLG
eukprot:scaffold30.g4436.t1